MRITDLVADPNGLRDLLIELKALQQTLILTDMALWAYNGQPLGTSLVRGILPDVDHCCDTLSILLEAVEGTASGLGATSISRF